MNRFLCFCLALFLGFNFSNAQEDQTGWKAGCATAKITPHRPMPMSGYASRKDNPSEGTEQDLFAKALALEDEKGNRLVIITTDLIGIISKYREDVTAKAEEKFKLPASHLVMNASHTHCGPAYGRDDTADYYKKLVDDTIDIIGQALENLAPSSIYYSSAKCGFAMNRRTPTPEGFRNHPNPEGIVDHSVPVLSVKDSDGKLKTVLFSYACHNTTMGFMKWFGDYAGYAQEYLEADHEGLTAMFMNGCSGDQNPYPRRLLYFAQRHGRALATGVEAAVEVSQSRLIHQKPVTGLIEATFATVNLPYTEESKKGSYDYPLQVVKFGNTFTWVGMGGEVTVGYSLRLKRELTQSNGPVIWVSGYTNDYNGYVPTRQIMEEGGYEASSRPWDHGLEEKIISKIHEMVNG